MEKQKSKRPLIRFPEYKNSWEFKKIGDLLQRISVPVEVSQNESYKQIGIRSNGKGIFHKEPVTGKELGNKRVFWIKENALIINIVFAWEQAIAKTTTKESGMIASHRFPMYIPLNNNSDINFLLQFFLTREGKILLELASPGGAGRNKTLGQKGFEDLKIFVPSPSEQKSIGSFFTVLDKKIAELEKKKKSLEEYKDGIMQKIFSQKLRFKDDNGNSFSIWEKKKLKDYLVEHKKRNTNNEVKEVFSVAKKSGVINQIEHMGRSYASKTISNYKIVFPHDVVYTKSPTSEFPFGIIKQNKLGRTGIVSVLYGVFTPINMHIGLLIDFYFSDWRNIYNYLNPIVQKGAKNTMNISNTDFLNGVEISLPTSLGEQIKITSFLSIITKKIDLASTQIEQTKLYKKGLSQRMFC